MPLDNHKQPPHAEPHAAATDGARRPSGVIRKMLEAQQRERMQLVMEASRIKGLMPLLMKNRNGNRWSPVERHELHQQFRALMYLSPYLLAFAMPGSFLMLPVLAWWLDRRRGLRKRD